MWIWLALIAATVAIWFLIRPTGDCRILVRNGETQVTGRLPASRIGEVQRFFEDQFAGQQKLRVVITYPRSGHRLKIGIHGRVTEGERQMIRNFLLTLL